MLKKSLIKTISVFFIMILFSCNVFAENIINNLSEVQIDTTENNIININMLFKNDYKEKAFLQKQKDGQYHIFLPNTTPLKNTKITYKTPADKGKIQLTIEGKTAIKNEKSYSYTKITTTKNSNYGIKLISKVQKDNSKTIFAIFLSASLILLATLKIRKNKNNNKIKKVKKHTSFSTNFNVNSFDIKQIKPLTKKTIIQKTKQNKTTSFNHANKATFDCFDIKQQIEDNNSTYNFKSMLKQTSNTLNNRLTKITHKHTNPITKITTEEQDELSIPSVEEFFTPINNHVEKDPVELISVLNITPNKGFYLTNLDDTIALFGFVNNNVFLFDRFKDLSQINLQARFYDRSRNNEIYIVRLDSFKAMIEVSDSEMKELARI